MDGVQKFEEKKETYTRRPFQSMAFAQKLFCTFFLKKNVLLRLRLEASLQFLEVPVQVSKTKEKIGAFGCYLANQHHLPAWL